MKIKLAIVFLFSAIFLCSVYVSAGADEGKLLYASKCGQCHKSGGSAPVFAPTKYASKQWERFFDRDQHKRKKDISGTVNAGEIGKIKQYLIEHAADSSQPEAAGLK